MNKIATNNAVDLISDMVSAPLRGNSLFNVLIMFCLLRPENLTWLHPLKIWKKNYSHEVDE
jgi:hypothetical protein